MQLLKKIIRNTLLAIICFIVAFLLLFMMDGKFNFLGYGEADHFSTHFSFKTGYFKDSTNAKITIRSLKVNLFKDSMYSLDYGDSSKILVWIIRQNRNVSLSTVIDTIQKRLKPEDLTMVFHTYPDSKLDIESKMFLHDFKNISIHFYNCKDIQNIISSRYCQYYHLKSGVIYLTSDSHSYYDLDLGLNNSTYSDFMLYHTNNRLYIFAMYSTKGNDISPDGLSSIINFSLI